MERNIRGESAVTFARKKKRVRIVGRYSGPLGLFLLLSSGVR